MRFMGTVKNKPNEKIDATDQKRSLIAHYARGSVGLQTKRYVTASEKQARKEQILAIEFSK
jgi:hypothetical protein